MIRCPAAAPERQLGLHVDEPLTGSDELLGNRQPSPPAPSIDTSDAQMVPPHCIGRSTWPAADRDAPCGQTVREPDVRMSRRYGPALALVDTQSDRSGVGRCEPPGKTTGHTADLNTRRWGPKTPNAARDPAGGAADVVRPPVISSGRGSASDDPCHGRDPCCCRHGEPGVAVRSGSAGCCVDEGCGERPCKCPDDEATSAEATAAGEHGHGLGDDRDRSRCNQGRDSVAGEQLIEARCRCRPKPRSSLSLC